MWFFQLKEGYNIFRSILRQPHYEAQANSLQVSAESILYGSGHPTRTAQVAALILVLEKSLRP